MSGRRLEQQYRVITSYSIHYTKLYDTEAEVICGIEQMKREVKFGFASDLLSDVLTLSVDNLLFITGLSNLQTIRTAEMADIGQILFVRGKKVTPEMCALAKENNIA